MDNLTTRATLVSLKTSKWTGRCIDKDISQDVLIREGATEEAGRFSKRLLPKDALKEITTVVNSARKYYKDKTLAWEEGKYRLLPTKFATEFRTQMAEFKASLDIAVKDFINDYKDFKSEAKQMLNGMYKEGDYPSENDLYEKFQLKYTMQGISDPKDFRCDIPENIKKEIQKEMQEELESQYAASLKKLYQRIYNVIKPFHDTIEKANKEDVRLFKSLIGNIEDLVSLLPDLNIMGEKKLEELTELIQNELCRFDIDDLKKNKESREEAIKASTDVLAALEQVYI